jgi:cytochrome c oxidase subunit 3
VAGHEHHPELRHHFADMGQQQNSATLGMWLFLVTEIMFFGGMFCAYLIYRLKYFNDFAAASQSINVSWGALNTAVLLVSSFTMAMAVRCAQLGKRNLLIVFLILTMIFGAVFLGVKAIEYHDKFVEHHVPGASYEFTEKLDHHPEYPVNVRHTEMFFSIYFAMTGMHALHMIIGLGLMTYLVITALRGKYSTGYYTPVENIGLYWHFVDVVWIYLFPLLYLIDRH